MSVACRGRHPRQFPSPTLLLNDPVTKQITAVLAVSALAFLAACGAAPTSSDAAPPSDWQANTAEADTSTSRVPNLFGSGN